MQKVVLVVDEFEKTYKSYSKNYESDGLVESSNSNQFKDDHQESFLSIMDGTNTSNKILFLLTVNETHLMNDYLKNRPNRIFYNFKYKRISNDIVDLYIEENLKDKNKINDVISVLNKYRSLNFDMMASFVEEVNRYPEDTVEEISLFMNMEHYSKSENYDVTIFDDNGKEAVLYGGEKSCYMNPDKKDRIGLTIDLDPDGNQDKTKRVIWSWHDFIKEESNYNKYVFLNENGYKLILKKTEIVNNFYKYF